MSLSIKVNGPGAPKKFETLSSTGVMVCTPAKYQIQLQGTDPGRFSTMDHAQQARITVTGNPVNYTLDGTTPTSSVGETVPVNGIIELETYGQIAAFQAIPTTGTASLAVTYFF